MSNMWPPQDTLLDDMQRTRDYCSLISSIREKHKIPISYPLMEVEINALGENLLFEAYRQLVAEDQNIFLGSDYVNPFLTTHSRLPKWFPFRKWLWKMGWFRDENWQHAKKDTLEVFLNISKSKYQEELYNKRKQHRQQMQNRKELGLTYNE